MSSPPPPSTGILGGALRNLGWLLASRSVLAVLSLVYLGMAARALGVVGFGRFALITGAAQALATLVSFQTWQIVVQYGVAPLAAGDRAGLARLFRGCAMLDAASALAGVGIATGVLLAFSDAFGIGRDMLPVTLGYAIVQVVTIRSAPIGILRLHDRFSLAALADSMTPVMRFAGAGLALLVAPTVAGFLAAWAAAELVTAATYWIIIARRGDLTLIWRGRGVRRLIDEHPGMIGFALSTNASQTLGLSTKQLPLLLVGGLLGTAEAGVFRLAAQLAQALAKLSQLLARAAFPDIVRHVRETSPAQLARLIRGVLLGSFAGAALILLIVALAGQPVLGLVGGRAFGGGWPILLWLAAAGCIDLATVGIDTVLTAARRATTVFAIRFVALLALLAAIPLLLRHYGATGIAMAVAAGSVVAAVAMIWASTRLLRDRRQAASG